MHRPSPKYPTLSMGDIYFPNSPQELFNGGNFGSSTAPKEKSFPALNQSKPFMFPSSMPVKKKGCISLVDQFTLSRTLFPMKKNNTDVMNNSDCTTSLSGAFR